MKTPWLDRINKHKNKHDNLYRLSQIKQFGRELEWTDMQKQDNKSLIQFLIAFENEINLELSTIDVERLAYGIQLSRSGIGGQAMTRFNCAFCGEEEMWGSTAVPNICKECAKEMATNIAVRENIFKDLKKQQQEESG